jgi:putative ABC transport system permease protein
MGESEILVDSLRDTVLRGVQTTLWVLYGIVGFILLIVCANVANLCIAKVSSRNKEVAVRRALGANRLRLLRQFTTESILLSLAGGVTGLLVSVWTIAIFQTKIAGIVPRADGIRADPAGLGFGLALSILVGVVLGVTGFWFTQRSDVIHALTERRGTSRHQARCSNLLVAGQIAVALILSIGMGLMVRSMMQLSSVDTGFYADNLVTFKVGIRRMNEQQRFDFSRDFLERLTALPGVKSASTDSSLPSSPRATTAPVATEGYVPLDGKPIRVVCHSVSENYFRTLQIPIRQGRDISPQEHEQKTSVAVVSETLAGTFWPDKDPIGRELICCGQTYRVVGIAADMVQGNVRQAKPNHLILPFGAFSLFNAPELKVVARTTTETGTVIEQARTLLADIDMTLPLYDVSTFRAQMNKCVSRERFTAAFLSVFASIALLLIVVGIYGVVSYAVTQRTREIGVRIALGAQKGSVLWMVLKHGMTLLLVGVVLGTAGALGLTRFLSSYLYEVSATDPIVFVAIPILLAFVTLLASYIPARRASKIHPVEALRHE